jgi:prepilin-type processing-associated H-X9-DG protein
VPFPQAQVPLFSTCEVQIRRRSSCILHGSWEPALLKPCLAQLGTVSAMRDGTNPYHIPAHCQTEIVAPSQLFAIMDTAPDWTMIGQQPPLDNIPSSFITFLGTGWSGWDTTGLFVGGYPPNLVWNIGPFPFAGVFLPTHGKALNVLSCDGHVAAGRISDLFTPTISASDWNVDNQPHPELW